METKVEEHIKFNFVNDTTIEIEVDEEGEKLIRNYMEINGFKTPDEAFKHLIEKAIYVEGQKKENVVHEGTYRGTPN